MKNEDSVDLARTSGLGHGAILLRHVLPNFAPALIDVVTPQEGVVIVLEASFSFHGVGVPPPNPSLGAMVADGRSCVVTAWWVSLFPGIAIRLVVMADYIVGDARTDRIKPGPAREAGMTAPPLSIRDLTVRIGTRPDVPAILEGVSLDAMPGETVGLVGEVALAGRRWA